MKRSIRILFLSIMVALILFPFGYLVLLSLSSEWRYPDLIPGYLGWKNWQEVWRSDSSLMESFWQSVLISLSVASSSTFFGFFISRTVAFHPKRKLLTMLAYFPYVLAPVIFAVCLSFFFMKMGLFGQPAGVILAQFMIAFPYAMIFFLSFWGERIRSYEQLVQTLGGTPWQSFRRVLLPLAKGMLLVCFFQTFLISWFEYGLTFIIGVGKVQTLTVKVFLFIKESNVYFGALACCMLIFPPVVLLYLNKRYVFNKLI